MQSTTTESVAAEVRAQCARQRVSQRDLAKVLGVSHATLFRRFSGEVAFDVEELAAVANYLDIPMASLLPADKASA